MIHTIVLFYLDKDRQREKEKGGIARGFYLPQCDVKTILHACSLTPSHYKISSEYFTSLSVP